MVPTYMLSQDIAITTKLGNTALGEQWSGAVTAKAYVDLTQRRTVDSKGNDVVALGSVIVNSGVTVVVNDKLEYLSVVYRVLAVNLLRLGSRDHHIEILLGSMAT